MNLTGVCIFHPSFSMVYVEGAQKFVRQYKRLMLVSMAWTEAARERGGEDVEIDEGEEGEEGGEGSAADAAGKGKGKARDAEHGSTGARKRRRDVWLRGASICQGEGFVSSTHNDPTPSSKAGDVYMGQEQGTHCRSEYNNEQIEKAAGDARDE